MTGPTTAMVLAAGLGTRMRPLSSDRPKALVEVGGRPLIDHMIDRLLEAGVRRVVVNVHAFADRLEAHLKARWGGLDLEISDEREELLDTGGGLKRARPLLGEGPLFVANIDSVWIERGPPALAKLATEWRSQTMDALLLLTPTDQALGFDGPGDFFMDAEGRLTPRRGLGAATAPWAYVGVQILAPDRIYASTETVFGLYPFWAGLAPAGRLHGRALEGEWMHVGDPQAREAAERRLAGS